MFKSASLKGLQDNRRTTHYNQWIFGNISPYLGQRILDVGGGIGNILQYLLAERELVVSIDVEDSYLTMLRRLFGDNQNLRILKGDIQDKEVVENISGYNIDTVTCINVLEHLADDAQGLTNMRQILTREGYLVLLVPAFKSLFSKWDLSVGHFRRYDKREIKDKLAAAGFRVEKIFYLNSIGFFGWFLNGRILRLTPGSNVIIEKQAILFDRYLVKYLAKIEKIIHPPFGLSLVVLAKANEKKEQLEPKICAASPAK